jgi:hypothetical protein
LLERFKEFFRRRTAGGRLIKLYGEVHHESTSILVFMLNLQSERL